MNIHNISTISRYETKLLRRSWLFRIFAILSLLVIVFFHMGTQSNLGWFQWVMVAMPSSIPFVNIYLFNIAQSVIAIFLAGSFLKRDKKLDTAEVIYVRPMSNAAVSYTHLDVYKRQVISTFRAYSMILNCSTTIWTLCYCRNRCLIVSSSFIPSLFRDSVFRMCHFSLVLFSYY